MVPSTDRPPPPDPADRLEPAPPDPAARVDHPPPAGPPHGGPPPPPAVAVRSDGPARLTAATIVSASGALLLLAAAATFLAVSWDTLGLTARVAAVGAGTAGAIVGGARLRRTLPAVGAVVFHLGALLLPVDALGLALQLDADLATVWIAVGATAVLTLPFAAHAGRSRVLAAVALGGVPVLATGIGLATPMAAPLLTALAALVALTVVRVDEAGPRLLLGLSAPVLALVAVTGPLVVAAGSALVVAGGGTPLWAAASAGWVPLTWSAPVLAGALAVGALAATAVLRRSTRWAGAVPVAIALVAVTTLLPGDAPRLARLLPWPLLFLAIESAVVAARSDRVLRAATARVAAVTEVLAALAVPGALWTVATATRSGVEVILPTDAVGRFAPDLVLAAVAAVTAIAWVVATLRRGAGDLAAVRRGTGDLSAVGTGFAALALAAAAATLAAPATGLGLVVCLVGVVAPAALRGGAERGAAATTGAAVLGATLIVGTWSVFVVAGRPTAAVAQTLLALAAAVVAGVLTERQVRHAEVGEGPVAAVVLLPLVLVASLAAGVALHDGFGLGAAVLAVAALLLACGARLEGQPQAADTLRVAAVAAVLLAGPLGPLGLDAAVTVAPAALVVAAVLAAEAVRCHRPRLLVAAAPVLVRGVAGAGYALTGSATSTGALLLALAVVGGLGAVVRPPLRTAGVVLAVTAGVPALVLLSLTPTALGWATVGIGLAVVAAGLATRQLAVAHVGGVVTTLGVWQLLATAEVEAVDAWLLAPALHLWLVGWPARRAGRVSSWVADVPPLALVVVPALLERLAGGSGWHAALAGTLALVAVVGGGAGRHAGPLVTGVVALVAVVGIETLAVVAAVPTWAWLTAGGLVLLSAGAAIERTGGAPVATVRRLLDTVAERFD